MFLVNLVLLFFIKYNIYNIWSICVASVLKNHGLLKFDIVLLVKKVLVRKLGFRKNRVGFGFINKVEWGISPFSWV